MLKLLKAHFAVFMQFYTNEYARGAKALQKSYKSNAKALQKATKAALKQCKSAKTAKSIAKTALKQRKSTAKSHKSGTELAWEVGMENVKKRYGLWTGIAMVIGIVIGSGVFIKAGGVLELCGGDLKLSLLAWLIGGVIMVASGFCFAVFASKVTKYNGVVDYVEAATNDKVGYVLAWIMTVFYYPIIVAIISLLAGSYFFQMIGADIGMTSWQNFLFAFGLVTLFVAVNYFSPALSAKFQISATVIKLIPIFLIAIVGLFASLIVGADKGIANALTNTAEGYVTSFGNAVKKTAFAYEGWVCATAINAELKESKKNLSRALVGGTVAILVIYLVYYLSLSAVLGNAETINAGANAPIEALETIFGKAAGVVFTLFIMISCMGTANGVTISCCRGAYTMACRGQGVAPEKIAKLGGRGEISPLSCLCGYAVIVFMLIIWYLALNGVWIFPHLSSMDEILCAVVYAIYVTMYVCIMVKFKGLNPFKRFVMPAIAVLGSIYFVACGTGLYQLIFDGDPSELINFAVFFGLLVVLTVPCVFFYKKDAAPPKIDDEAFAEPLSAEETSEV